MVRGNKVSQVACFLLPSSSRLPPCCHILQADLIVRGVSHLQNEQPVWVPSNCMADPPGLLTDYTRPSYSSSRLAVFPWIGTISRNVELPGLVFRHFRSVGKITHSCTWTKDSSPNLINHCSERLIPFQYHNGFCRSVNGSVTNLSTGGVSLGKFLSLSNSRMGASFSSRRSARTGSGA